MPMIGAHSTMERPDPVSLVTPPRMIMPNITAQQASNQMAMALWLESFCVVDGLDKFVSCFLKKFRILMVVG